MGGRRTLCVRVGGRFAGHPRKADIAGHCARSWNYWREIREMVEGVCPTCNGQRRAPVPVEDGGFIMGTCPNCERPPAGFRRRRGGLQVGDVKRFDHDGVLYVREKAVLVDVRGSQEWIPRSVIVEPEAGDGMEPGDPPGELAVEAWFARDRGFDRLGQ